MEAATVVSLVLGAAGAATGVAALSQQWLERRRKLTVEGDVWLDYDYEDNGRVESGEIRVTVANPTLVALPIRYVVVDMRDAMPSVSYLAALQPERTTVDPPGEGGALVQPRSVRVATVGIAKIRERLGEGPLTFWPECVDMLGRCYKGRPFVVDLRPEGDVHADWLRRSKRRRRPSGPPKIIHMVEPPEDVDRSLPHVRKGEG